MNPTDFANSLIAWLLDGDVALQYQVHRDLLGQERADLQARIAAEGWGKQFLAARQPAGHWGRGFYQPKWTSTHYTLLDLRHLCIAPDHAQILESVVYVLNSSQGGGWRRQSGENQRRERRVRQRHGSELCQLLRRAA